MDLLKALQDSGQEESGGTWQRSALYSLAILYSGGPKKDPVRAEAYARRLYQIAAGTAGPDNAQTLGFRVFWESALSDTGPVGAGLASEQR